MNVACSSGVVPFGQFLGNDSDHNFSKLGGDFLRAAKILNKEYQNAPEWTTCFMAFQALELYLKSYLLRKGRNLRYVEKQIGHKLTLAVKEAKTMGLILPVIPELEQAVMEFSEIYSRKDLQYRSIGEWKIVPPDLLLSFVDEVVRAVSGNPRGLNLVPGDREIETDAI